MFRPYTILFKSTDTMYLKGGDYCLVYRSIITLSWNVPDGTKSNILNRKCMPKISRNAADLFILGNLKP